MIDYEMYKSSLLNKGKNLAQVRKNQSDDIMNVTFTGDVDYKKVYILTNDGWQYEDAKYQTHVAQSILKDNVDYYLQFRPKVHYPIGSYVIIPDDTSFDINLNNKELENPFLQPISERTQWWLIVGRDDSNQFVRYNVLKCNWNFQWIENGKIQSCYGCTRTASSYTSCGIEIYNMARCIRKLCNVFLRICWNYLRDIIPKQKDEICLCGMV